MCTRWRNRDHFLGRAEVPGADWYLDYLNAVRDRIGYDETLSNPLKLAEMNAQEEIRNILLYHEAKKE